MNEEEKLQLAILVEELYSDINMIYEGAGSKKEKDAKRSEYIQSFIDGLPVSFRTIPKEEINQYIQFVLNRTKKNMEALGR